MTTYIVLGCPRTGTSLISGILHKNGVEMGPASEKTDERNKAGYFEVQEIANWNEQILGECGGNLFTSPDDRVGLPLHQDRIARTLGDRARTYVGQDWGWKDPRTVLLWRIYKPVIDELGLDCKLIFTHRNRSSVAASLARANIIPMTNEDVLAAIDEYERRTEAILIQAKFDALRLHFEDWWDKFDEQARLLDGFMGRALDYGHFDPELRRC
jgi:hypothetical protein